MTNNTTASYVSGYRDCRGCREHSVNLALTGLAGLSNTVYLRRVAQKSSHNALFFLPFCSKIINCMCHFSCSLNLPADDSHKTSRFICLVNIFHLLHYFVALKNKYTIHLPLLLIGYTEMYPMVRLSSCWLGALPPSMILRSFPAFGILSATASTFINRHKKS